MRDSERVVLRIVEGKNLVFCLLHQDVQPDGQIRADHVHQAETRNYTMAINLHLLEHDVILLLELNNKSVKIVKPNLKGFFPNYFIY